MDKYAIIDLGSNSVRLHIYHLKEDGSYYLLESVKEKVRLSEGMTKDQMIQMRPLQRSINTLKLFVSLIKAHKIHQIFPLATAAIRNSRNREHVLKQILEETGLDFKVLSGEEEANLDYLGVVNSIEENEFVLLDIGGGSTEIVWVKNRLALKAISIPFGSVNLTEMYLQEQKGKLSFKKLEKDLREVITEIGWLKDAKGLTLVGLGGAVRTFAKVDRQYNRFPIWNVHNYRMNAEEISRNFELIMTYDINDLDHLPGVSKKRSDVLQGGLMPLKIMMDILKSSTLVISENGLREGFFYKCLAEKRMQTSAVFPSVLEESLENHLKKLNVKTDHAFNIWHTVQAIFEALRQSENFDQKDLKVLRVASLLHDIGLVIDYDMHHRHGFYMMMNTRLYGLTNKEITAVAYLIGSHRNVDNKWSTGEYHSLMNHFKIDTFEKYTGFLRLAEQLDRSESGRVKLVEAVKVGSELKLYCESDQEDILEFVYAKQVQGHFQKHFNLKLSIEKLIKTPHSAD